MAFGGGVTPAIGIRLGGSFTAGSYLNQGVTDQLPPGHQWNEYRERVLAFDASVSRGYVELRAETVFSSYEVPAVSDPVRGNITFLEGKYTFTPRFFTAIRLERNAYAFIRPRGPGNWQARQTTFYDGELGLGFRLDARTLVKGSVRLDDWRVSPPLTAFLHNGTALAIQISRGFEFPD